MSRRNSAREIGVTTRERRISVDVKRGGKISRSRSGKIAVARENGEPAAPHTDVNGVISDRMILVIRGIEESVLIADLIGDARIDVFQVFGAGSIENVSARGMGKF